MKEWNQSLFMNGARPSLIFKTEQPLSTESYTRWKEQFSDSTPARPTPTSRSSSKAATRRLG